MDVRFSAGFPERSRRIHLAVRSRERRYHYSRLCDLYERACHVSLREERLCHRRLVDTAALIRSPYREHAFLRLLPLRSDLREVLSLSVYHEAAGNVSLSKYRIDSSGHQAVHILACRDLDHHRAEHRRKHVALDTDISADPVADCHLYESHVKSTASYRVSCQQLAGCCQLSDLQHVVPVYLKIYYSVFVHRRCQRHERAARELELRRYHIACIDRCYCKGCKCRRHIYIHERAGHAVLSAYCRYLQFFLHSQRSEQCCHRLAPSCRILAEFFEIFLESQADLPVVAAHHCDLRH